MIKYTCGAGTPEEAEANCTYFIRGECTASFCEYRRKKQTNADRVRAMSDEELAAWAINEAPKIGFRYTSSETGLLKWLKQSAEDNKNG